MYTLFISDLHLDPTRPELTTTFLNWLNTEAVKADAVYILGDFFAVWLGDDVQSPFTQSIIKALKQLTERSVPVFLMHGNRDFLLGQQFLTATGCQLLTDPALINLYGTPTLLMHGDTLCTLDVAYQRFRKIAHNPFYQRLFLNLPLWIRRAIANYLRRQSMHQQLANDISDTYPPAILETMQANKAEILIHGHTHRPEIQFYSSANLAFKKIVLSDWDNLGNALMYLPNHTFRLYYFS